MKISLLFEFLYRVKGSRWNDIDNLSIIYARYHNKIIPSYLVISYSIKTWVEISVEWVDQHCSTSIGLDRHCIWFVSVKSGQKHHKDCHRLWCVCCTNYPKRNTISVAITLLYPYKYKIFCLNRAFHKSQ